MSPQPNVSSLHDMLAMYKSKSFQQTWTKLTYDHLTDAAARSVAPPPHDVYAHAQKALARLRVTDAALNAMRADAMSPELEVIKGRLAKRNPNQWPQRLADAKTAGKEFVAKTIVSVDASESAALSEARDLLTPAARERLDEALMHPIFGDRRSEGENLRWYVNTPQAWTAAQLLVGDPELGVTAQTLVTLMRDAAEEKRLARRRKPSNSAQEAGENTALIDATLALLKHPRVGDSLEAMFGRHAKVFSSLPLQTDVDSMLTRLKVPSNRRVLVMQEAGVENLDATPLLMAGLQCGDLPPGALFMRPPGQAAETFAVVLKQAEESGSQSPAVETLRKAVRDLRTMDAESRMDDLFWAQVEFLCDNQAKLVQLLQTAERAIKDIAAFVAKPVRAKSAREKKTPARKGTGQDQAVKARAKSLSLDAAPVVAQGEAARPEAGVAESTESKAPPARSYAAVAASAKDLVAEGIAATATQRPMSVHYGLRTRLPVKTMLELVYATMGDPPEEAGKRTYVDPLASAVYHFGKHAAANPKATIESYIAEARALIPTWKEGVDSTCPRSSDPRKMARSIYNEDTFLVFSLDAEPRVISYRNRATMGR